jgi:DNA-binding transcriptional ArsR family regulator
MSGLPDAVTEECSPDEGIHQSPRLRIIATLNALPHADKIEFTRLRAIFGATDGNLGAHLTTLEGAGYVIIEKDSVARKPRTWVSITGGMARNGSLGSSRLTEVDL